jgi:hypothetical protein
MPTTHDFSQKLAKKSSEGQKICEERHQEEKFPISEY